MKLLTNPKGFGSLRVLVVGLALSSAVRCGEAPTQPLAPMAPAAPPVAAAAPVAPPILLGGRWHGTYTFSGCTDEVEVTLTHIGNSISGFVPSSCVGGPLSGTLQGSQLNVQLIAEGIRYQLSGTATSFRIDVNYGGNDDAMSLHLVRSFSPRQ